MGAAVRPLRPGAVHLVLGGQRSGKSSHAAARAAASSTTVTVVCPAVVRDAEFADRVARHRDDRPAGWRTVETFDLAAAVAAAPAGEALLVDALDTWLAETLLELALSLDDEGPTREAFTAADLEVRRRLDAFVAAVAGHDAGVIVIAGQPGFGAHVVGAGARAYVDLHGFAVQHLSAVAAEVELLVAGRPLSLPPPTSAATSTGPGAVRGGASGTTAHDAGSRPPLATAASRDHGDTQVPDGTLDLAVNVLPGPPAWLAEELAAGAHDLAAYPDDRAATAAAAARHGRPTDECLVTAGAAEAFWLLPRVLRPRRVACLHPGFTEAQAAWDHAGTPVTAVWRDPDAGWAFDPADVPDDADLVLLGRPDNPTGVVDATERIAALCRPGRTVVVDEAFADFLPDPGGLADDRDLPGLVVLRSLTKLWGLAGLRVGYLVAHAPLVAALRAARQPWSTPAPALHALTRLVDPEAEPERAARAAAVAADREVLLAALRAVPGVTAWDAAANFVLLRTDHPDLRGALLERGIAVRRGHTFPGLDRHHVRVAVRDAATSRRLAAAIADALDTPR